MARGWESKSIEAQMDEAASARERRALRSLTPAEIDRQARRDRLLLSRARTLEALQGACDARYRGLLEKTLEHLDAQLKSIEDEAVEG
jgi:hypothetical protein